MQICTATSRPSNIITLIAGTDGDLKVVDLSNIQFAETRSVLDHKGRVRQETYKQFSGKSWLQDNSTALPDSLHGGRAIAIDDNRNTWTRLSSPQQHVELESGRLKGSALCHVPGMDMNGDRGNVQKIMAVLDTLQVGG